MKSVGTQLREARLARGWTVKAASKATKIKETQLLQLEAEEYQKFAATAYVRGFIRIYAKALGINDTALIQELDKVLAVEGDEVYLSSAPVQYVAPERRVRPPTSFRRSGLWVIFVIVAFIFGILVIRINQILPTRKEAAAQKPKPLAAEVAAPKANPEPPVAEEVPVAKAIPVDPSTASAPKAEPVTPPAVTPGTDVPVAKAVPVAAAAPTDAIAEKLVLHANQDCWVRVLVVENGEARTLFEGVLKQGQEHRFVGEKFVLKEANPSSISLIYNGQPLPPNPARIPTEFPVP